MANATPSLQSVYNATEVIPILGTSITEYGTALGIENFNGVVGNNQGLQLGVATFNTVLPSAQQWDENHHPFCRIGANDGDLLVGAMILDDCNREVPCFAEECVCTYYAEDNNGAGYKIREDYLYLVCVPENFEE